MRPLIQVARSDWGGVPCFEIGSGDPIVILPVPPFSHLEFELGQPAFRAWYYALGATHRVIRYDLRGTGVARHLPPGLTYDDQAADLEAVAEHFGFKRFALMSQFNTTPFALKFAAEHPASVSNLILAHPTTREDGNSPRMRAVRTLLQEEWEMFVETVARARTGWNAGEDALRMADLIRASANRETVLRLLEAVDSSDAWPYARRIGVPTMVLYRRPAEETDTAGRSRTKYLDAPLDLTARIPGAVCRSSRPMQGRRTWATRPPSPRSSRTSWRAHRQRPSPLPFPNASGRY